MGVVERRVGRPRGVEFVARACVAATAADALERIDGANLFDRPVDMTKLPRDPSAPVPPPPPSLVRRGLSKSWWLVRMSLRKSLRVINRPIVLTKHLTYLAWSLLDDTVVRRLLPRLVNARRRLALVRDLGKLALLRRLRHRLGEQVPFRVVGTTEPGLFRFVSLPLPGGGGALPPEPDWAGLEAGLASGGPLRIVWDHSRVATAFCYARGWLSHAGDLFLPPAAVLSLNGLAALARRDPALVVSLLRRSVDSQEAATPRLAMAGAAPAQSSDAGEVDRKAA
jgi:hypothetical protein